MTLGKKEPIPNSLPTAGLEFPPLRLVGEPIADKGMAGWDAWFSIQWKNGKEQFAARYQPRAGLQSVSVSLPRLREDATRLRREPLLVVPYLRPELLDLLTGEGISGIDLCGNGVIQKPGCLFVYRTGAPNRFRADEPIKNVYRNRTALVARVFLIRPRFDSVNQVYEEIGKRDGRLSLATVSLALKAMVEDLVIAREGDQLRLLQPEKLLDRLAENYTLPSVSNTLGLRLKDAPEDLSERLGEELPERISRAALSTPLVVRGFDSVTQYAFFAGSVPLAIYCRNAERIASAMQAVPDRMFPDLILCPTASEEPFFDVRWQDGIPWASPVQTYLELMRGEKRDQETAEQVRAGILRELETAHP